MITVRRVAGVLVILFGVSVLFDFNMPGAINPFNWWPMLLILPGLGFEKGALDKEHSNTGMAVPAGIFLTYGGLLLICSLLGWHWMSRLWPLFLAGPAIGMLQLYWLDGRRDRGLLIPVFVLGGLSLCFLMFGLFSSLRGYLGPILLIGLGLFLLIPKHRKK